MGGREERSGPPAVCLSTGLQAPRVLAQQPASLCPHVRPVALAVLGYGGGVTGKAGQGPQN